MTAAIASSAKETCARRCINEQYKQLEEEKRKADMRFHDDYVYAYSAGPTIASSFASPSASPSYSSVSGSDARIEGF